MTKLRNWLASLGLDQYTDVFEQNEIDGALLPDLTDRHLKELGVSVMGHRMRMLKAISAFEAETPELSQGPLKGSTQLASAVEAERRQLTVMFCDLVGSTSLSEQMDPEMYREVIAAYQGAASKAIDQYEGYIARYMGDGLLVYFGYPRAHEDDAERAVRAGLGVLDAIGGVDLQEGVKLRVRVGIATGLVVAGDIIGEGASEERAVLGDTPNLAARLQGIAPPNSIVIAESTHRLVEGLFVLESLGHQSLKGISAAATAYRVAGVGTALSRFEAAAARGLTPLVGRESEIHMLLNRWALAKEGEGQVVLLSGEAGLGKSRIVRGFQEQAEFEPRSNVLYFCSPHHQSSALYPVIDQLERGLGFEPNDESVKKLDKLDLVLGELGLPISEHGPVLASLLSVPMNGRYPAIKIAPEELRRKTFESLLGVFDAMTAQSPVLAVLEDAHWMDPSTEEFFGLLIERIRFRPLLLVITHRTEYTPPWGENAHATSLALNRLSRRECTALVDKITEGKQLPTEVLDQIVEKTDGVPLFVEELTKTVLDSELLEEKEDHFALNGPLTFLGIPTSLQDALMARLDRLARVKEVAQLAATIGRSFGHDLLAAVSPASEGELAGALARLVEAGLVYRRGLGAEIAYEFKHALVQEIAYQSLLKSKRRQFHQRIAQVLMEKFPKIEKAEPELLAHHYTEAGSTLEAVEYWRTAGQRAVARSAYMEAITHLDTGLLLIEQLPAGVERSEQALQMQTTRAAAVLATKGLSAPETAEAYVKAQELCEELGNPPAVFSVMRGLNAYHYTRGEYGRAYKISQQFLRLSSQQPESAPRSFAHAILGGNLHMQGGLLEAREHLDAALGLYDPQTYLDSALVIAQDSRTLALTWLSSVLCLLGYPDQGLASVHDCIRHSEQLGYAYHLAIARSFSNAALDMRRDYELARDNAERLMPLAVERGLPQFARFGQALLGQALIGLGNFEEGIKRLREGIGANQLAEVAMWQPSQLGSLADGLAALGRLGDATDTIEKALALSARTNERWNEAELHRLKGELMLKLDGRDAKRAEACFNKSLGIAHNQSAKWWELRTATSLARLWRDQGRHEEARDLLVPVYGWFTEGFATVDLKEAKALLSELS